MRFFSILFILAICSSSLCAQQLSVNTTRFIGGDASCGGVNSRYSIATRDGGILLVGASGCWGGGDIPVNTPDSAVGDQLNVLIVKMDSNMQISWVKVYGGSRGDGAMSACQTTDGGYGVLATTESQNGDVTGNHSVTGGGDLWLVRIDSLGNLLWEKCFGGPYDEQAISIASTHDNGFILFGATNGAGGDVPFYYNNNYYNWFVVKTDSMGNKQWVNTLGGTGEEYLFGSILSADTGYYLVSGSSSKDHDCTDTTWHSGINTDYDYYLLKLDTTGHKVWCKSFGGSRIDVCNHAMWDSRDSSIVMIGESNSKDYMVTGNTGAGANTWVVKTDKYGNLIWETSLGDYGNSSNEGKNLIEGPNKGYLALTQMDSGTIHGLDNRLFLLDSVGNMQVDKVFGGLGNDKPTSIIPYKQGYAATGFTLSSTFTEGINIGRIGIDVDAFVSYINYWPLSVSNINNQAPQIQVYSNPAKEQVHIAIEKTDGRSYKISITDIMGRVVVDEAIFTDKGEASIDVSVLAGGVYMVLITDPATGYRVVKKIVKE